MDGLGLCRLHRQFAQGLIETEAVASAADEGQHLPLGSSFMLRGFGTFWV